MIFVLNHLLNGASGMSQSHVLNEFPVWVPVWHGVNRTGHYGAKNPYNTHQKALENTLKSKLGSGMLLSRKLKVW